MCVVVRFFGKVLPCYIITIRIFFNKYTYVLYMYINYSLILVLD